MREVTHSLYGDADFASLLRPAAVVAAELALGRRVVIELGPVAPAVQASAAIPGLFTPVPAAAGVLVDGGLISRVPADLLDARGCGLRLASLIRPATGPETALEMARRIGQPFGLRTALGASWRLLGWWDAAAHAERADVIIDFETPADIGHDFARAKSWLQAGRDSAEAHLPRIRAALDRLLTPGWP